MTNDARIRRVFLEEKLLEDVKRFAAANGMSESEVLREAMEGFTTGTYPVRERVMVPKNIWIDPEEYAAFTKKVRDSDITIRHALELALGEML